MVQQGHCYLLIVYPYSFERPLALKQHCFVTSFFYLSFVFTILNCFRGCWSLNCSVCYLLHNELSTLKISSQIKSIKANTIENFLLASILLHRILISLIVASTFAVSARTAFSSSKTSWIHLFTSAGVDSQTLFAKDYLHRTAFSRWPIHLRRLDQIIAIFRSPGLHLVWADPPGNWPRENCFF